MHRGTEEVRNLAMRSAEAARNTAALISGAVQKAEDGVTLNHEAPEAIIPFDDDDTTILEDF